VRLVLDVANVAAVFASLESIGLRSKEPGKKVEGEE